ncbi:WGxxGxxG family protein [Paenibacillus sp. UNC496MF]|uniref:WGxxGxxG family protein n=1 Tax=Paenibacillus sp. UNC496MF TaxID=1502753 RepID=UPI001160C627|nr:WGxxGxxG family protein [Paenibacillus sp. UNC496MF]
MRKKFLLTLVLVGCLTFLISAGVLSARGTVTNNANDGGMNNQTYNSQGMNANSYNATSTTGGNYRANAANDNNGMDWDWLGWLGLLGLIGLRGRSHNRQPERR